MARFWLPKTSGGLGLGHRAIYDLPLGRRLDVGVCILNGIRIELLRFVTQGGTF